MDLNKLKTFLVVAEYESISKAAIQLGYTQSGISHTLKRLEEEINLPLFHRNRNGVTLTNVGEELLPIVRNLISVNEQLDQTIYSLQGIHKGDLTIGTFASISILWLPKVIHQFQLDYPDIKIHLKEGGIEEVQHWIQTNNVDLGFCSAQPDDDFDWIPLKQDPLLAILPKDYPIEGKDSFDIKNFKKQPFIMSAMGIDYDIHRVLQNGKVTPDVRFSSMDDYAIISMVENKLGISILPELIVKGHPSSNILTLPLKPFAYRSLGIGIKSKKMASPATKKFIEYAIIYIKTQQ